MGRTILLQVDPTGGAGYVRAQITEAIQAGFGGIEWLLTCASGTGGVDATEQPSKLDPTELGLSIPAASIRCLAREPDGAIEQVSAAITEARKIGASVLSLELTWSSRSEADLRFGSYQDRLNTAYTVLRALRSESAVAGVVLAIVAPQDGFLLSPVESRELIDTVNAWNVGVCVDAGRVAPIGSLTDWIRTLGSRVQAVRVGTGKSAITEPHQVRPSRADVMTDVWGLVAEDRPIIVSVDASVSDWAAWTCQR